MDAVLLIADTDLYCRSKVWHFFAFRPTVSRCQRIALVPETAAETLVFPEGVP